MVRVERRHVVVKKIEKEEFASEEYKKDAKRGVIIYESEKEDPSKG
jgi:hypothetical protein